MKKIAVILIAIVFVHIASFSNPFFGGGGGKTSTAAIADEASSIFSELSGMTLDELLRLQSAISDEIAMKRTAASIIEPANITAKTLRELFPCVDLAKAIRDNIGLTSIDQPIPEGKLDQMTSLNYALYSDPRNVYIDSVEGIQYLKGIGSVQFDGWMYPHYDKVTSLPEEFYSLPKVWQLSLGSTSITEISPLIGNMTTLKNLYLDYMDILTLPEEIGYLYQLEKLNLEGSTISELPDSMSNLLSLKELDLSDTLLTEFPVCILSLPNLNRLDLSSTQISELPSEIAAMSNLRELDISNTKISSLPKEMYSMNLTTFKKDGLNIE